MNSRTACARIDWFVFRFVGRGGGGSEDFAGAGAGIDGSRSAQFLKSGAVERKTVALFVRAEWPAAIGAFLPSKAEPAKVFEHGGDEFRPATVGV